MGERALAEKKNQLASKKKVSGHAKNLNLHNVNEKLTELPR